MLVVAIDFQPWVRCQTNISPWLVKLYVGVVKVSLVQEGAEVVCDGHGRRCVCACCAGSKGGIGMGQW